MADSTAMAVDVGVADGGVVIEGRMPPRGAIRKWIAPRTRRSCAGFGIAARTTHTRNLWR